MYTQLTSINEKPPVFGAYTAQVLWNDPHTSQQMLRYHLNPDVAVASRTHAFIDRSVAWMQRYFALDEHTAICDFGCGPGLYTSRFAAISRHVTGVDFSASSIGYAKGVATTHQLSVEYRLGNYLEFESDQRFDLITMIMCDFCALSPEQRRQLLRIFHHHLNTGGKVLLDVYSLNAYETREEQAVYEHNQLNGFWSGEDYYAFVTTFKYPEEKVVLDKYTIYDAQETEKVVFNWLQYFSLEDLRREVEASGFQVAASFSDVAGTPFSETHTEFAVVLEMI